MLPNIPENSDLIYRWREPEIMRRHSWSIPCHLRFPRISSCF